MLQGLASLQYETSRRRAQPHPSGCPRDATNGLFAVRGPYPGLTIDFLSVLCTMVHKYALHVHRETAQSIFFYGPVVDRHGIGYRKETNETTAHEL